MLCSRNATPSPGEVVAVAFRGCPHGVGPADQAGEDREVGDVPAAVLGHGVRGGLADQGTEKVRAADRPGATRDRHLDVLGPVQGLLGTGRLKGGPAAGALAVRRHLAQVAGDQDVDGGVTAFPPVLVAGPGLSGRLRIPARSTRW